MYIDIVVPDGNEESFLAVAEKLGYCGICFLYPCLTKEIRARKYKTGLKVYAGALADQKTISQAKDIADLVLFRADEKAREIMEKHRPDMVFDFEVSEKKDYMHQRNSGLNHILCNIAAQKGTAIGMSFSTYLENHKKRAIYAGRLLQNIRLSRKYGAAFSFFSLAKDPFSMHPPKDLESFLVAIGMHPKEAKAALLTVSEIIEKKQKRKSKSYISEGVEIIG